MIPALTEFLEPLNQPSLAMTNQLQLLRVALKSGFNFGFGRCAQGRTKFVTFRGGGKIFLKVRIFEREV